MSEFLNEQKAVQDGFIRILVVEPMKKPYTTNIANDFEAMQKVVDGDTPFVPLPDSDCHIYCNDEGKPDGLPGNRRMDNVVQSKSTGNLCIQS
ncbi:MAG: DUF3846 domain-containing protein [Bacilli bacterium]